MADVAPQAFLDPKVLGQIGDLALLARSVVDGFLHGLHRSSRAGLSLDFAEHRPYQPGDDLRRIDWRVYGRTDRFYLKTYEADTNADMVVVVDASASMDYGTDGLTKFDYARYLAASLAWLAQRQGDRVGLVTIAGDVLDVVPPSTRHLNLILHTLARLKPHGGGQIPQTLEKVAQMRNRTGMVVLVSDCYEEPAELRRALGSMRSRGNDVVVFHLIDPAERDLPWSAPANFEDAESGERMPLRPDDLRKRYREIVDAHRAELLREFGRERIDYAPIETDTPLDTALRTYLDVRLMGEQGALMPLLFLVPAVLAGLAAVIVPVLLHLRRRERERPTRFPSLMFLQRITITTARRRRITDLPLLLVRALVVVLAVLAFARPVIRPKPATKPPRGTRRVVLLLDRSMSMGHLAVWPAAVDSARAVVRALSAGDRIAVVSFDDDAVVEAPLSTDHAAALAAIGRIHPGSGGTRFGAAVRAARELLVREADVTGGEVLVVSDLQRSGAAGLSGLTLPPAVTLRAINAAPRAHGNSAVTGVAVQRLAGADLARSRLAVSTLVATRGLAASRHAHVTMSVNGRVSGGRDVTLPSDGTTSVAFEPVPLPAGEVRLVVALDHDSLAADDSFDAVVPAAVTRRVILAVPGDLAPDEALYFERAVETGTNPAFRVERRNVAALDQTVLRDAAAVVLFDVPIPAGAAGTALAAWVHDGGGLISAAGMRLANRPSVSTLAPGTAHGVTDRTADRGGLLGGVSLEHPVFAPFRGGASAPLGGARFFRYPKVTAAAGAQVVASFDDGAPALLERQEGLGRVLMVAMPLDATSGDFPLQPTYLPFVRGMLLHAAGNAATSLWRTVGDPWLAPPAARNPVVKSPSGALIRPDIGRTTAAVTLGEAGFYTIYDGSPSGDPLAAVAVNPAPRESDLTPMAAGDILVGVGQDSVRASTQAAATLSEAERRQQIWRTLLLVAAILLIVETVMGSRGWRGTAARIVGTVPEGSAS